MITLKRISQSTEGTFGVLMEEGTPFALSAERPWAENCPGISCIPRGWYTCRKVISPRFGETFEVADVPGRSNILFHAGNTPEDSKGCILVGAMFGTLGGHPAVLSSRKAFAELKAQVAYLRTVETYAGQLEQDIATLPVRFPAAYVAYGGSDFSPGALGTTGPREKALYSVFVCAKNLRGNQSARKGSEAGPGEKGAYALVKDVIAALANNDLGLDIEMLRPVRCSLLFAGGEMAVYSIELMTGFEHA